MKKKHTITISTEKNSEFSFRPDIKKIQQNISFLLDLICTQPTEVSIRFCGTNEMQEVNGKFRQKFRPTDVLSFPPDRSFPHHQEFLGDILVCIPVCEAQAKRAKHTLSDELLKMMTHALVHLKGFDHDRNEGAERVMSKLEAALKKELLLKFGKQILNKEHS